MRNASAVAQRVAPHVQRPHLVLVTEIAPRTPAPARQRFAALLAGLICGFVLAALAAASGGGSPAASLGIAVILGVALIVVLAHARRVTVLNRRRTRARRAEHVDGAVISLDAVRAA